MKSKIFLLLALAALVSCKKDEDPVAAGPLLTYKVPATPVLDDGYWIFIADEDGNIIDTRNYKSGDAVELKSSKTLSVKKINVTLMRYQKNGPQENWAFTSYLGVPIGQTWEPDKLDNLYRSTDIFGSATVKVLNYPASVPLGELVLFSQNERGITSGTGSMSPTNNTFNANMSGSPAHLYFIANKSTIPSYVDLPAVTQGSTFNIDYNTDLKTVDNVLTFNFPGGTNGGTIYGVKKTPIADMYPHYIPGLLHSFVQNQTSNTLKLGYNNGADTYKTTVYTSAPGQGTRTYFKIGTPPPSTFPSVPNTVTVIDDSYKKFSFSSTGTYQMRTTRWYNFANLTTGAVTEWVVYSDPDSHQTVTALPAEIVAKYPTMDLSLMKYQTTTLTTFLDGFTYADFIAGTMDQSTRATSSEWQSISWAK